MAGYEGLEMGLYHPKSPYLKLQKPMRFFLGKVKGKRIRGFEEENRAERVEVEKREQTKTRIFAISQIPSASAVS
ncbi:uncharacterized protein G2W53_028018 [Senna tora]|uniref:Uncharacterized protein n=1 Tax=Senna tora TaxID=362788 RepID=A0A834TBR5_9FABA|nr:uncharacterized protein G2W53_028018 [Senna tora]